MFLYFNRLVKRLVIWGLLAAFLSPGAILYAQTAIQETPNAPKLEFVFEEIVELGDGMHPGATPWGDRNIVPITGGTFSGPKIKGKILPGGWDWQLASKSGCNRIQADYMIQTDDGVIINVLNKGSFCGNQAGPPKKDIKTTPDPKQMAASGHRDFTTPVFEAPLGKYEWLNGGAYVGTLEMADVHGKTAVRIRFYKAY